MPRKHKRYRVGPRPELSIPEVLAWADAHRQRTGKWPQISSGPVVDGPLGEIWRNVDTALRLGLHGLSGGSSLAQLLASKRLARNQGQLPPLTRELILAWVDTHHQRTASWPTSASGAVLDAPGE